MPSMFGGDQLDKGYAPSFYIGEHFVWQTERSAEVGDKRYRIGRTSEGKIVCSETKINRVGPGSRYINEHLVAIDQLPNQLLEKVQGVEDFKEIRERIIALMNKLGTTSPIVGNSTHNREINS